MIIRVYVGMALTEAPVEFRESFRELLLGALRAKGCEILDFVGLEGGTEVKVYEYDLAMVEDADVCVFLLDHASTGLGVEVERRRNLGKRMLLCKHEDRCVSRLPIGMAYREQIPLIEYFCVADIIRALEARDMI